MGARPTASTGKRPGGGKGPPGKRAKPGPRPEKPPATKREKKAAARALKAARRPETFPVIEEMVRLWETLRDPKTPKPEREALVARILEKIAGRVKEFGEYMRPPGAGRSGGLTETEAVSHRASRVVQACLKYGTAAQRAAVAGELKGRDNRNLLELARNPYGHFLVRKLLTYAKKDELPRLVGAFRGRVPELLRHPAGCHVIDDLYALAPAALQATLVAEFYGPEVALFGPKTPGSADLPALLRGASAAQRATILGSLHAKLLPILEKGLVDALPVHVALREYLKVAAAAGLSEVADALAGQHLLHIVHTRPGAQAAAIVVGGATAKQRKRLARELKPHLRKVAFDDQAYLVLLAVLTLVDDTVMVGKTVVQELVPLLGELVFHKSARRVVLQLLAPDNPKYVPRAALAFLSPDARGAVASARKPAPADPKDGGEDADDDLRDAFHTAAALGPDGGGAGGAGGFFEDALDDDLLGDEGRPAAQAGGRAGGPAGSKKDAATRRRELLYGKAELAEALVECCRANAAEMLASPVAGDVLFEVVRGGDGGILDDVDKAALYAALAAACAGDKGPEEGPLEHFYSSRLLRKMVLAQPTDGGAAFGGYLWEHALRGRCEQWVGSHAEKILAAFVQSPDAEVRGAATEELEGVAPEKVREWKVKKSAPGRR